MVYNSKNIKNMGNIYLSLCWNGPEAEGSYYHMWWTGKKRGKNWKDIHSKVQKILKVEFEIKSETILWGIKQVAFTF